MKNPLLILLCLPFIGFGQDAKNNINDYKYIVIEGITGVPNVQTIAVKHLVKKLHKAGFKVI